MENQNNQDGTVMTFDEILADKTYQSEFDKRIAKALDTAKTKWDTEAAKKEKELTEKLTAKEADKEVAAKSSEDYQKLLKRIEAMESDGQRARTELNERTQLDFLRKAKIPDEQLDFYHFKIAKLVTGDTTFEQAAAQYIKERPPQIKPPEFATGSGKPLASTTETEKIKADFAAAGKRRDSAEMSRLTRLAKEKGVALT